MPRVVHFEITAKDPQRVVDFYQKVFDWEAARWEGPVDYWLVTTGDAGQPGINGGIMLSSEGVSGTVNTVEVADLDATVEKVLQNGGRVALEKTTIPGVGYQVYCQDVEGTLFGLHQADPRAGM